MLLVSLLGCTAQPLGSVQLMASGQQTLSSSDVSRVTVTVSAANMASLSVDLARASGSWGGTLGNIPAGTDRSILAEAFDSSGVLRFRGQASAITITANQTATVAIMLQELAPAPAFSNEAPLIDSVFASISTVQTGGTLSLTATAHDPNAGDTLTWAWSASGGTFSAPAAAATSWTAPASPGIQTLSLTVKDSRGLTAAFSLAVNGVSNLSSGSTSLELPFNVWPSVSKISASRTPLDVGQATTVSVNASDADGDALSYQWKASCAGTWTNATSSTASFVPSAIPAEACNNCLLTVTVQDGRGGQGTGTLNLCVAASSIERFPPSITQATQSAPAASAGQSVTFDVTAADPQGASLTFAWTADAGSFGVAQNTANTSHTVWTSPSAQLSTPATITVTVTNAYGRSVSKKFTVLQDPCAEVVCSSPPGQCYVAEGTCSDGACSYAYKTVERCDDSDPCTQGDMCNGAGGCSGTPISCNSPPGQCYDAAGTCSNGACNYPPKASGVACANDGNACTSDVCNGSGTCSHPALPAGSSCGSGLLCDGAGHCVDGACWIAGVAYPVGATNPSASCQECNPALSTTSWSLKPSTALCRAVAGACDVAEFCTGMSATCPADGVRPAGTICRAATNVCDAMEVCSGSSAACPGDNSSALDGKNCGTSYGSWGSCGGFTDACDTTGTQSRTVTASTCSANTCSASNTTTETQECTRSAPNTTCAAPSYGAWSACSFSDPCTQTGTQSRTVTTYAYSCASGQCVVASTGTETQSCSRNTDGFSCGSPSAGAWSACSGFDGTCGETGSQYRSVTSYTCSNGACISSNDTQERTCSRSTAGTACGSSTGSCGACTGFSDTCGESGTQSCTVTNYTCSGGSCNASSSSSYSQSCSRNTDGISCDYQTICGDCTFADSCTTQGTMYCSANYASCRSGSCSGWWSTFFSQSCSRPTPPPIQCSGPTYGQWSACSGGDACGRGMTQSRTVTSYSYDPSSCQCVGSTSTETQDCSSNVDPDYMACGGQCVDTQSDYYNCGGCGHRCANFKFQCESGECVYDF